MTAGVTTHLHVVTGGPGAGKTSLALGLAQAGVATVGEGARTLIRQGVKATGIDPRADPAAFAEAMRVYDESAWETARENPVLTLFDRGLPDVLAFCRLEGIAPAPELLAAIDRCRYAEEVFLLPPWPDIYATDAERFQSPDDAEASFRMLCDVYPACGYRLLEVPRLPIPERVAFVLARVG